MSLSDDEFATAIAAAAFAIASLETEDSRNQKWTGRRSGSYQTTAKSNKEEETWYAAHGRTSTEKTVEAEQRMLEDETFSHDNAKKTLSGIRSSQKAPAMHQNEDGNNTSESGRQMISGEKVSSPIKQTPSLPRKVKWDENLVEYSRIEKADDWENKKLAQIRNRYEKRNASILEWESKKKEKAKHQMEQEEQGLQRRRTKAMQECHDEVVWVDKVASRARALADERTRNDETKARKKALEMRSASKTSHMCFCF